MKKLLICTLSLFAFVGLTGCASEKKLTAEEAKTELNAVAKNTAKAVTTAVAGSLKLGVTAKGEINNFKAYKTVGEEKTAIFTVNQAKAEVKANASLSTATDFDNKIIKLGATGDASAKASADIAGMEKKELNLSAKGKATAYLKGGNPDGNFYVDYDATISEDLAKLAKLEKTAYADKLNIIAKDFDMEMPTETEVENFSIDFDSFVNDWSIFKKKGNKIIADCSDLKAFKIDGDVISIQDDLAKYGLTLSVSKFEIGVDKQQRMTSFDFQIGLKGKADFEKMNLSKTDIEDLADMLSGIMGPSASALAQMDAVSGTLSVDFKVTLGATFKYTTSTITIPEELTKLTPKTMSEIMGGESTPLTD